MKIEKMNYNITHSEEPLARDTLTYQPRAKARKTLDVLATPTKAIADATAATFVEKGCLLRVKGTTGGFLAFGDELVPVPTSSTDNTLETPNGFFMVVATHDYVRTSAAMRLEVIPE